MTKKTNARLKRDQLAKELGMPSISPESAENHERAKIDPMAGCSDAVRQAAALYHHERMREELRFIAPKDSSK